MELALSGMKVLDFTHVLAGPYCTQMLADMGADVIKVENPKVSQDDRGEGPYINGESTTFMMVNRNKRSLALNLKDPRGKEILLKLAESADVLVQNFRPGTMERLGLGYDALRQKNPGIIYCSISGFGLTGPYKDQGGYDLMAQGLSGLMSVTGEPGGVPLKTLSICDFGTGMLSCWAILVAYIERLRSGHGQVIDAALLDTPFTFLREQFLEYFATGEPPAPTGWWDTRRVPYQAFETADGTWIVVDGHDSAVWPSFCRALGMPELARDSMFCDGELRHRNCSTLSALLSDRFRTRPSGEWLSALSAVGVPCGEVNTVEEVLRDAHVLAREMVVTGTHPKVGEFRMLGMPVKLSETPGRVRTTAPTLGQHTAEILGSLGYAQTEIDRLRQEEVI